MEPGVRIEVELQPVGTFRCRPGAAGESFDIVANHRIAVIKGEQRVKAYCLELALPDDAAASTFVGRVDGLREIALNR